MNVFRSSAAPGRPADMKTFSGSVATALLASNEDGASVHVYRVEFQDGGRTHWHRHSGTQWLFVVGGRIKVQSADGPPQELDEGDAVVFAPGEKHWHGAAPGRSGTHLAVNINVKTDWLEPVTDDQYRQ